MKKVNVLVSIMLISSLVLFASCTKQQEEGRQVIKKGDKTITNLSNLWKNNNVIHLSV